MKSNISAKNNIARPVVMNESIDAERLMYFK